MTRQTEAQKLADELERRFPKSGKNAAAELRRLHAENAALTREVAALSANALDDYREIERLQEENFKLAAGQCLNVVGDEGGTPYCRLHAINAQLLEALKDIAYQLEKARIWGGMDWHYNPLPPIYYLPARDKARAAIAAAKGEA